MNLFYLAESGPIFICQKVDLSLSGRKWTYLYLQESGPIIIWQKLDLSISKKLYPFFSARKWTYFICQKVHLFYLPESGPIIILRKVDLSLSVRNWTFLSARNWTHFYLPESGPILSAKKCTYFICQKVVSLLAESRPIIIWQKVGLSLSPRSGFISENVELFYLRKCGHIFTCPKKVDISLSARKLTYLYLPESGSISSASKWTYIIFQKVDLFYLPDRGPIFICQTVDLSLS